MNKEENQRSESNTSMTDVVNAASIADFRSTATRSKASYGYSYSYNASKSERPITEYVSVLVRFRYLILICVLAGLIVGFRMHLKRPIIYETSAMVNVGTFLPPTDGPTAEAIRFEQSRGEYLTSLLPILSSNTIAKKALLANPEVRRYVDPAFELEVRQLNKEPEESKLRSDFDSSPREDIPVSVLERYLGYISTYHHDKTTLISMTATGPDPEMVAKMANAHAEAFMEIVRQQRFVWATTNVNFLKKQVETLKAAYDEAKSRLDDYSRENSIFVLNNSRSGGTTQQRIEILVSNLSDAVLNRVTAGEEARARRRAVQTGGYVINGQTLELVGKLNAFLAERSRLNTSSANRYYLKYLQGEIDRLKSQLKNVSMAEIKDMEIKASAETQKEGMLRRELEEVRKMDLERSKHHLEFTILERDAKLAEEALAKMQTRLQEALVNAESDQKTVLLVDPAVAPENPLPAKRVSTLLSGALFGLFLGIALAFFFDFHNARIRTVSDLNRLVGAPVLGVIPVFSKSLLSWRKSVYENGAESSALALQERQGTDIIETSETLPPLATSFAQAFDVLRVSELEQRRGPARGQSSNLILVAKPQSRESESFRNLRATLKYSSKHGNPKLVLVTSGQKGDGKTTIAVNLAAALAQTAARTVIIDADMRMPTVHKHFGQSRTRQGLSDYLGSKDSVSPYLHSTEIPHLKFMPAGSLITNPAELLGSRRFTEMLESLADEFDHVIVDTPPVGEIADALLICRNVDGVLLVTRSGVTPRTVAQVAVTRLNQVCAKILGTVLNGLTAIDGVGEGYGGYYYSSSYINTNNRNREAP